MNYSRGFKRIGRNLKIYGGVLAGATLIVGLPFLADHIRPRQLISKEQFEQLYNPSNIPLIADYSKGGEYAKELYIVDSNNDGVVDALAKYKGFTSSNMLPLGGSGDFVAVWHTEDWTGDKSSSRIMTSKIRELANQQLKLSKDISSLLLEEARK